MKYAIFATIPPGVEIVVDEECKLLTVRYCEEVMVKTMVDELRMALGQLTQLPGVVTLVPLEEEEGEDPDYFV